jgi:hypothetical protein
MKKMNNMKINNVVKTILVSVCSFIFTVFCLLNIYDLFALFARINDDLFKSIPMSLRNIENIDDTIDIVREEELKQKSLNDIMENGFTGSGVFRWNSDEEVYEEIDEEDLDDLEKLASNVAKESNDPFFIIENFKQSNNKNKNGLEPGWLGASFGLRNSYVRIIITR